MRDVTMVTGLGIPILGMLICRAPEIKERTPHVNERNRSGVECRNRTSYQSAECADWPRRLQSQLQRQPRGSSSPADEPGNQSQDRRSYGQKMGGKKREEEVIEYCVVVMS